MQPTVLHELHSHPISGTSNFVLAVANIMSMLLLWLYSLLHHMPQERHLSLELEGQRVPCGPSWACLFLGICDFVGQLYPTQAIAVSVFILIAVILSLPHCCLSLRKHFIFICLVHSRTWCCIFLHTLQYSVFTPSRHSFSNSPASSVPSIHFSDAFSLLSYMCILYSSSLILSKSFVSQYCFR